MPAAQAETAVVLPTDTAVATPPAEYSLPRLVVSHSDADERDTAWWICETLEKTLIAGSPGLHASTPMVGQLAVQVGRGVGLDAETRTLLDLAVRVRDIGMLALPDDVILATAPLSPGDWAKVNRHPILGAEILECLAPVADVAPIVRSHHERWDGNGYPDGRSGSEIPLASRVIAVCDAFVAMATDRPHRRGVGAEAALEQVSHERGTQFDPTVVDALVAALVATSAKTEPSRALTPPDGGRRSRRPLLPPVNGRRELASAIAEFDVVPAFAPAYDRVLAVHDNPDLETREIVTAIESDTGLTIAVLRRAQAVAGRRSIAAIPEAVAALSLSEIRDAVEPLPRADFPWRTTELEVLMHRSRVHAQAVTRAAVRIARELGHDDDVVVPALLHDIGKLVLGRADSRYAGAVSAKDVVPEQRLRQERRAYGLDHASLGGLLLSRWGLPKGLERVVAAHHRAEAQDEVASFVRLADMVAHHVQGDAVDRKVMLRLASICGMSPAALRDLLFDLPHPGGSDRRRAEPCPLSSRETALLALLAEGKVYKEIAAEAGLTTSTVRSHLHNVYGKLNVSDRAQAVLMATHKGWI